MYIRSMASYDESTVREIFSICHPGADVPPLYWYFAYPTFVAIESGAPIGFTSFSMNVTENGRLGVILQDCCVLPRWQGLGIGRALMAKRLEIARAIGATFAGCSVLASHENRLQTIRGLGFREVARIPKCAGMPEDVIAFIKDLE